MTSNFWLRTSNLTRFFLIVAAAAVIAGAALLLKIRNQSDASPQPPASSATSAPIVAPIKLNIPYEDAAPILSTRRDSLPAELRAKTAVELEAAWPGWVQRHNAEIRRRLERGDEDSIVNLWLYGTSFTGLPRATGRDFTEIASRASAEELLLGRLDALVSGLASPGTNERLRFARDVVTRKSIDPTTSAGKEQARRYLIAARERVIAENDRYRRTTQSAKRLTGQGAELTVYATLYSERGLSSDTSIAADFAIERALESIKARGRIGPESVRRIAVVGPGLDFTDKAEGYDFYPQQTIQPFALIDSLTRVGLAKTGDLQVTTFDLSPRVNQHLEAARQRALQGDAYVLQLPLDRDTPGREWHPDLVSYWQRLGDRIGDDVQPIAAPSGAGSVRVRAVRVRPAVVLSMVPHDLNIVLERLAVDERFDLVVATNVLVYYDLFEQALALANVSKMLRPGGFFLTNYAVAPAAPMESSASLITTVFWDRQQNGDTLFWYQRR